MFASQAEGLENLHVARATMRERRLACALMPEAMKSGHDADVWIAWGDAGRRVVAAAAIDPVLVGNDDPAARAEIHVIADQRRRGIASMLLGHLKQAALANGARVLLSWQPVADPGGQAFALHSGAVATQRRLAFSAPMARLSEVFEPLAERLQRGKRIPSEARLLKLHQVDPRQLAGLYVQNLDTPAPWQGGEVDLSNAYSDELSVILEIGDRLAGCLLIGDYEADGVVIEARAVARWLRGGWANLWMMNEACRRCLSAGRLTARFSAFDDNADTLKLARRVGAVEFERHVVFELALDTTP